MTNSLFRLLHLDPFNTLNLNSGRMNINFNTVSPTEGEIVGISLTIVPDLNIAGDTDGVVSEVENLTQVLNQVETLAFTISNHEFNLKVISRSDNLSGTYPFFLFTVEPFKFPLLIAQDAPYPSGGNNSQGVGVVLSPFLNDIQFANSDFNPLFNNVNVSRKSTLRYEVDRNTSTPLPSNFEAIANSTATFAEVQDSLYYDTGRVNSRYKGSKTSTKEFGGVPPILTGKEFTGESFSIYSTDGEVCAIDASFRVLDKFFHTGPNSLPEFTLVTEDALANTLVSGSVTVSYSPSASLSSSFEPNDIIKLDNEYMRVVSPNNELGILTVERGYLNTLPGNRNSQNIQRIVTNRVFKFEDNNSGVTLQENSKIWINDSNTVVTTDQYGTVYTSSAC